jgi:23S rRNA (uridine2552-2'-O)-methyltransferase
VAAKPPSKAGGKPSSGRGFKVRVRSKGLKASSKTWLARQLNDPYVAQAKSSGYRSRAAFKLIELDDKFHFLKTGARVVDLGAAPGGWSQVARARVGEKGSVVGADILDMEPLNGVQLLKLDMRDEEAPAVIRAALSGPATVVLSDMAAPTTGHRATDHLRTTVLFEAALDLAEDVLAPEGIFVGKVFQGGAAPELLARLKKTFRDVRHVKPPASRAESVELYLVALGFRRT